MTLDHELNSVQKWARVIREGSESHAFKDRKDKEDMGEVAVESDACETPIHATTREDINDILADGYEVDDDILPAPDNIPINTGKTDQLLYKEVWKWNDISIRLSTRCSEN